jgi:hypothetical protein
MQEQTERQRQIAMLLRQLAAGLSSYQLFPGDIEQSAFVSAVERIHEAARQPLAAGPVALEIRGRTFVTPEGPLPDDETTHRLAVACYERRVEQFTLRVTPEPEELAAMYEALTRPVDDVADAGGVEALLGQAGVTSISLTQIEPQAIDSVVNPEALPPEQAETWEKLRLEQDLVTDLEDPTRTAAEVYRKFRDLVAALPPDAADDPELYRRFQRAVSALPGQVRRDLVGVLIDESRSEPVASRMVSSITDHQLGELLVELGEDGERDPVEVAEDLVSRRSRQQGLVELVRELAHTAVGRGSSELEEPPEHEETGAVKTTVAEMVGEGPVHGEDATAVTRAFPVTPEDLRAQALNTLRDYLVAEEDLERLKRVLDLWVKEVQGTLLDGGTDTPALVEVMETGRVVAQDADRSSIFSGARKRILTVPFLQELLGPDLYAGADRVLELLDPLGETGVEGLLDVLGEETDRTRRSTLVSMLARLATRFPAPVEARLDDQRWYVVRNAVNIIHKAEGGRDRVALLEKASTHAHAAVRREVIWGLVSILGSNAASRLRGFVTDGDATVRERAVGFLGGLDSPDAVQVLAGVARSSDDTGLRRRALDELSHSPSAEAPGMLRELAQFRSRPRLPWSLRRYARKLLRGGGS